MISAAARSPTNDSYYPGTTPTVEKISETPATITARIGPCLLPIYDKLPSAPNCSSWKPRQLTHEKAIPKMYKNMENALNEHFGKDPAYASVKKALPSLETLLEQTQANIKETLRLTFTSDARKGERPRMEDRDFYKKSKEFVIAAVFDGHGGNAAAQIALENLESILLKHRHLQLTQDKVLNVHAMLEATVYDLNQKVLEKTITGTTAVILYIDRKTNLAYTATVGDSEANLYRKYGETLKSIPLSCVRDWTMSDFKRLSIAYKNPKIAQDIHTHLEKHKPNHKRTKEPSDSLKPKYTSKDIRANIYGGLNVSRALGDQSSNKLNNEALVIPKPKINLFGPIQPGDIITLASDGQKDFCTESEIVNTVNVCSDKGHNLSRALVEYTLAKNHLDQDNISVVTIHVGEHVPKSEKKALSKSKEVDLDASTSTCETEECDSDEEDLPCEEDEESDGCYYTKSKSDPCA